MSIVQRLRNSAIDGGKTEGVDKLIMSLIFYILWYFDILKILLATDIWFFHGLLFLRNSKRLLASKPVTCLWPQPPPYIILTNEVIFPLFYNHPRARYQATRDHIYRLEPSGIIQSSQSWAVYPILPYLTHGNSSKIFGLDFPLLLSSDQQMFCDKHVLSNFWPLDQNLVVPLWTSMACGDPPLWDL